MLLLDPDACSIVVEEDEVVDDAVTTPFVVDELFTDELTGTFSDVVSDGDVLPFV